MNLDLIRVEDFLANFVGSLIDMNIPENANKMKYHYDIALGFVLTLTICCAIATGLLSYSFNNRIGESLIFGLVVVLQGILTWSFSRRK